MRTIREIRDDIEENAYAKNKLTVEVEVIEGRIGKEGDKARDGLQQRLGDLRSAIRKHDQRELVLRDEYADVLSDGVRSGRFATEEGLDFTVDRHPESHQDSRRRADIDGGLHAIQRCEKLDGFSDESAQRVEKMLRSTDRDGVDARYLAAVGDPDYASAFWKVLPNPSTGHLSFTPREAEAMRRVRLAEQERAMTDSTGSTGGFGLPITIDPSIVLTNVGALNPLREISRVEVVSTYTWRGISSDGVVAGFGAEATELLDNSPVLVQPSLTTARGTAFVPMSFEWAQDYPSAQQELVTLLTDAKLVLEATKFLLGTGVNEPAGILNIGGTGGLVQANSRVLTATGSTVAYGDWWLLKQAVPVRFLADSMMVWNPTTGDTAYQLSPAGSTTLALLMPQGRNGPIAGIDTRQLSTLATGAVTGTKIAIAGNFKKGFLIADRIGASVEYIPQLFGAATRYPTGQRGLLMWFRLGTTTIGSGSAAGSPLRYLEVR
jgi:HK97 family phage major capsid protein